MSNPLKKIEEQLRAKFTKAEYEELMRQTRFVLAMKVSKTPEGFERLCEVGEELLAVKQKANPAARQFRQGSGHGPQSPPPSRA